MQNVNINNELTVSKLIFGTDKLVRIRSKKERLSLMSMAVDLGITHFDTAPLYGFGLAERSLRSVLKTHRSTTVTSKVGLYPPGSREQTYGEVMVRKGLGRVFPSLKLPSVSYAINDARISVEQTLRSLGRERLDLLLIHDPTTQMLDCDEWHNFFSELKKDGLVGTFGIDGAVSHIPNFVVQATQLCQVVQCRDDLRHSKEVFCDKLKCVPNITYGYMADSLVSKIELEPLHAFCEGINRFEFGAVIGSTTKPNHLKQLCRIIDENRFI